MSIFHKLVNDFDYTYDLLFWDSGTNLALAHGNLPTGSTIEVTKWPNSAEMQEAFPDAEPTTITELNVSGLSQYLAVDRFRPFDYVWCDEWSLWIFSILQFYCEGTFEYVDIDPIEYDEIEVQSSRISIPSTPNYTELYLTYLVFDPGGLQRRYQKIILSNNVIWIKEFLPVVFSVVVTSDSQELVELVESRLDPQVLYKNRTYDTRYKYRPDGDLVAYPNTPFTRTFRFEYKYSYSIKDVTLYTWNFVSRQQALNSQLDLLLPSDSRWNIIDSAASPRIRTPRPLFEDPTEIPNVFNNIIYNNDYVSVVPSTTAAWYILEVPVKRQEAKLILLNYEINDPGKGPKNNDPNQRLNPEDFNPIIFFIGATNNFYNESNNFIPDNLGDIPNLYYNFSTDSYLFSNSDEPILVNKFGTDVIYRDVTDNVVKVEEDNIVAIRSLDENLGKYNNEQQFNALQLYSNISLVLGVGSTIDTVNTVAILGTGVNELESSEITAISSRLLAEVEATNPKPGAYTLESGFLFGYWNHLFFVYELPIGSITGFVTVTFGPRQPNESDDVDDYYYLVPLETIEPTLDEYWKNVEQDWFAMLSNIDLKEIREIVEAIPFIDRSLDAQHYGTEVTDPESGELVGRPTNLGWYINHIAKFFGINYNEDGINQMITNDSRPRRPIRIVPGTSNDPKVDAIDIEGRFPFDCVGMSNENLETGIINFQNKGDSVNSYPQFTYKVKSNQFVTTEFGSTEIQSGDYVICYTFQQLMQTIMQDLDKAIGMANAGANAIPNADGSDKICTYEGLGTLVAENAFMLSSLSRQSGQNLVSSLIAQGVVLELLKATGYPLQFKEITGKLGGLTNVPIPYPGLADNSPTVNSQVLDILNNLGPLLANLLCVTESETTLNSEV